MEPAWPLQTVIGLLVLSLYHPLMLGFSALLVAGIGFVAVVLGRGAIATAIGESDAKYAMVGWMEELARHPGIFRHPEGQRFAVERVDHLATAWVGARRNHFHRVLRQLCGALGLQVLAGSALLALGGALVVAGQLTLGQLVASELIITAIVAAVARFGKQLESFYDLLAAVDKLGVLFDLPLETDRDPGEFEGDGPIEVSVRDLRYGYGDRPALDGLSLELPRGGKLLLEGPTGSGKSTLLDLLHGLRPPRSGFITFDDNDLRDMSLDELRRQVFCIREPEIFPGSILDNVRVARPWLSRSDLRQVLKQTGLLATIRELPRGLDTELSSSGAPLSDGQVATLMFARAIVAAPRLLLIDNEAVFHLERAEEVPALDAVLAEDAPWTAVIVSSSAAVRSRCTHRLDMRTQTVTPCNAEPSL